jgi:hypothetical protein
MQRPLLVRAEQRIKCCVAMLYLAPQQPQYTKPDSNRFGPRCVWIFCSGTPRAARTCCALCQMPSSTIRMSGASWRCHSLSGLARIMHQTHAQVAGFDARGSSFGLTGPFCCHSLCNALVVDRPRSAAVRGVRAPCFTRTARGRAQWRGTRFSQTYSTAGARGCGGRARGCGGRAR